MPSSTRSSGRVSLEFYPPKGISAERALMTGAHVLRRFDPDYQTVTFGADGSAIEGSLDWPSRLQKLNDVPTAAHITLCQFEDQAGFLSHAETLWEQGIERLVVLRGDCESGDGLGGFASVAKAVEVLKARQDFDVSIAAYPEPHPKALSAGQDMDVLLAKQDAGADRAITQYFFNNADFYRFRDSAVLAGFEKDIVPGVIPIVNFDRIRRFSERCGASIPQEFAERFQKCGDDKAAHSDLAREIIAEQVSDLAKNGVDAIHVYTLNRVDLTADAIRAFKAHFDGKVSGDTKLALVG